MKKREKQHPEYYAISAYERLAKKRPEDCAEVLGISPRTYKEKIKGYSDFSATQGTKLAEYLGVPQDQLFLI